jgi:uncharacterized protein
MSSLFFDSSALAKRYLPESGTRWIRQQITAATSIIVCRITSVEIMSAVARRHREGVINGQMAQKIQQLVTRHIQRQYLVIELNEQLMQDAVHLVMTHPLRAYDAVQLASAKRVNTRLVSQQLSPITFLCADTRLLQIAQAEGLSTDNPNNYP